MYSWFSKEIEHYDGEQNQSYDTQKVGRKNKSSIKQRQSKLISEQEESYQSSEPTTGENLEDSKSQHTSKSVDDELIDEIEASPERSSDEYGSRDTKDANQSVDEIKISSGSEETKDIMRENEGNGCSIMKLDKTVFIRIIPQNVYKTINGNVC